LINYTKYIEKMAFPNISISYNVYDTITINNHIHYEPSTIKIQDDSKSP